jgi:hypothetical protein
MIKLDRNITPALLNPDFVKTKTQEFKDTSNNVWNIDWIKECLLSLSHDKCAYCECDLKEESKYMEVEHFEDKDSYPDKVLDWDNLLPSCKRCNGSKSTHDVIAEPIINPFKEEPSIHIYFRLYRMKEKDTKGRKTIDVVNLNHYERAVQKRFEVGEALEKLIDIARERLELYVANNIIQRRNKLLNIVEDILKECQPNTIYSATCATVLHTNDTYGEIKKRLKELDLWNDEFEHLDSISNAVILLK